MKKINLDIAPQFGYNSVMEENQMTAARYDLVIDQGSDFALEFTVSESGTVKNLTGYSARCPAKTD